MELLKAPVKSPFLILGIRSVEVPNFLQKMIRKLLAKYGRHFWVISLSVTIYAIYDFVFDEGDC